jgi:hypothetical protein
MIKIRLDVDYPYPSRFQSFLFTTIDTRPSKNYLKNSKILAKMFNESPEELMAYWFFTPQTIPDAELLAMLHPDRHEVALHVATHPYPEWERLEKATKRKVKYYTVHGTARLVARLMWRRKITEARAPIPVGFPLKSFYDFPTLGLDRVCYGHSVEGALRIAKESVAKGEVLHVHPEWLFQRGTLNHRGPYYEVFKQLLRVDTDLDGIIVQKRSFAKIARRSEQLEYTQDVATSERFFEKLADRGIDIFTFVERRWCCPLANPSKDWLSEEDNIALLKIIPYPEWYSAVGKKTRNMIRKAEKSGVKTEVIQPTEKTAEGIWKIYNETPIRQGRAFSHYGFRLEDVKRMISYYAKTDTYIAATLEGELVGFIQLTHGDQITVMSQILSLQKHWDKAVNNALVAKAVEICAARNEPWLMYGRMGNHPSLDDFKESNGFTKCTLTRYYVFTTGKGRLAAKFGLHKPAKDALPEFLKSLLVPVFNWVSRTKVQFKTKLR